MSMRTTSSYDTWLVTHDVCSSCLTLTHAKRAFKTVHTATPRGGMQAPPKGRQASMAYVWPSRVVTGCAGCRTSHTLMLLSTDPVAIRQSLYLHQSAVKISYWCPGIDRVAVGCRKSQTLRLQSPEADRKTSSC